nr:hypothetical protein [Tanacetum cinerariifolium]
MSSPNHPTFNIEDAFSSNFLDYTTASPGNISPDPPNNLSMYLFALLAISPFHNVQVYNDVANKPPIPPQDPIPPPTILTPSQLASVVEFARSSLLFHGLFLVLIEAYLRVFGWFFHFVYRSRDDMPYLCLIEYPKHFALTAIIWM